MKVVSLFNGMSCGKMAIDLLGLKIEKYYSSEIDKHAVKLVQHLYPDTIQLGDVTKYREWDIDWKSIDLLLAGSPCQGFSFAGKQLAFDDPRSKLFFVFIDILNHIKSVNPSVKFLLENVKMKKEHELVISQYCGVTPIEINSAFLSAQNRVRLYWTNIANEPYGFFNDMRCTIPQPKDKEILLRDILETDVDKKYYLSDKAIDYLYNRSIANKENNRGFGAVYANENEKSSCIDTRYGALRNAGETYIVASRGRNPENPKSRIAGLETEQQLEPRFDNKTNCLTSVQKDNLVMQINPSLESGGKQPYQQNRIYDENGISPALCANKSDLLIKEATAKGFIEIQPGECFDFENPNSNTRRGRKMDDKSNCLMATETKFMQYTYDYRIRRLTPRECMRLQTVPEHLIDKMMDSGISDTQLYRMAGNGWTIDVIAYIISHAS